MTKIKKYKLWYWIFLIVGMVGLINLLSVGIIVQNVFAYDMYFIGYLELGQLYILNLFVLGGSEITKLTSFFISLSSILLSIINLSIIWLVFAFVLKRKANAIESPTEENLKKLKHLDVITVVAVTTVIIFFICVVIINFDL